MKARSGTAIVIEGLVKRYGNVKALDGLNLSVATGTVHGLLGPNGAGKTTAVRALTTQLRFDSGRATVAGYDVAHEAEQVRSRIAVTGQYAAVDEILSGRQNLVLFGRLLKLGTRGARRRSDELLQRFGLEAAADTSAAKYSGGMRRRLDLAASLIRSPEVLFLDEPTTGLDPRSRNQVWDAVRSLVAEGTTVLLTSQYLDEVDQLAHQIAVMDGGRVVASGTSDELKARTGGDRLEVVLQDAAHLPAAAQIVSTVSAAEPEYDRELRTISAHVADGVAALIATARALHDSGIGVRDIGLRRPTLDEVFLELTGGHAHDKEAVA